MSMIRPETEMKDSGIEWIGDIPESWTIRPLKSLYTLTTGFTPNSKDDSLYDENGETWVTIGDLKGDIIYNSKQKISKKVADMHRAEMTKQGSLMYSFKLSVGTVAVAGKDLFTNEAIASFLPKNRHGNLHYLKYASSLIIGNANTNIYGAFIMNQQLILNAPLPLPSLDEQQAIADYLDETCSKIDEIIAEAKASIDEYKELKQSVIFEAVTKGLNKNVEMKDSGIEWIGEIPVDWVVKKFKYVATVNTNLVSPIGYEDYHQIAPDCIEKDSGRIIKERTVSEAGIESWNQLFKQGQLIYSKIRPTLNKVIIAPYDGLCSADMYPLDVHENIYFVQFVMLSKYFVGQVGLITQDRVKMPKINQDELSNVYVAVPEKTEQKEIVDWLNVQLPKYDSLITEKESLINDLEAYKKSLIYEVVTGKRRAV